MTPTLANSSPSSDIAVIIVNYATADMSARAVDSVLEQSHEGYTVEVHLVDNASPGEDAARLTALHEERHWGPRVQLWLEDTNHGFGRGNNVVLKALAAREVSPKYVFLLNPDAWVEGEAVAALARFMDATPDAGAVGGGNFDGDGNRTEAAFRFPGILSEFERTVNFGPISRLLKAFRVPLPATQPAGAVDWVSGASVMFRFDALLEVGFFDAGFFLYYEEVDLMRRLKEVGWQVYYLPEARIQHIGQVSTGVNTLVRRPDYLYRSWRRYFDHSGRAYALAVSLATMIGSVIGVIIARILSRPAQVPPRFFRDHWHYVVAPLLGLRRDAVYDADSRRADGPS